LEARQPKPFLTLPKIDGDEQRYFKLTEHEKFNISELPIIPIHTYYSSMDPD